MRRRTTTPQFAISCEYRSAYTSSGVPSLSSRGLTERFPPETRAIVGVLFPSALQYKRLPARKPHRKITANRHENRGISCAMAVPYVYFRRFSLMSNQDRIFSRVIACLASIAACGLTTSVSRAKSSACIFLSRRCFLLSGRTIRGLSHTVTVTRQTKIRGPGERNYD